MYEKLVVFISHFFSFRAARLFKANQQRKAAISFMKITEKFTLQVNMKLPYYT